MQMLATAVANLHQVERILPALQALGRRHADYGVTDKHYEVAKREAVGSSMCFWWIHFNLEINRCHMSCLLATTMVSINF
jgi:hypothetical protein